MARKKDGEIASLLAQLDGLLDDLQQTVGALTVILTAPAADPPVPEEAP
jgi:hypothetical protein